MNPKGIIGEMSGSEVPSGGLLSFGIKTLVSACMCSLLLNKEVRVLVFHWTCFFFFSYMPVCSVLGHECTCTIVCASVHISYCGNKFEDLKFKHKASECAAIIKKGLFAY